MDDIVNKIEAVLFASGKGLTVEQLSEYTDESVKKINKGLEELRNRLEEHNGAITLSEHNDKWKLTVKSAYLESVKELVSETDLASPILKTLAIIAFKSPVLQADIIHMRGQSAYDHIKELAKQKFITKDEQGRSYLLKITDKFYNYFDVAGDEEIQEVFAKLRDKQQHIENLRIVESEAQEEQKRLGNLEVVDTQDKESSEDFEAPIRREKTEEEHEEEKSFLSDIDSKIEALSKRVENQKLPEKASDGETESEPSENGSEEDENSSDENEEKKQTQVDEEETYL